MSEFYTVLLKIKNNITIVITDDFFIELRAFAHGFLKGIFIEIRF